MMTIMIAWVALAAQEQVIVAAAAVVVVVAEVVTTTVLMDDDLSVVLWCYTEGEKKGDGDGDDFFFLQHHQICYHQGILNMEWKNTTNGFSSWIVRGGQERRIRYIYGTSWYGPNRFRNATKGEIAGAKLYSSASAAAVTRLLNKNNSNCGSGRTDIEGRRRIITQFIRWK